MMQLPLFNFCQVLAVASHYFISEEPIGSKNIGTETLAHTHTHTYTHTHTHTLQTHTQTYADEHTYIYSSKILYFKHL